MNFLPPTELKRTQLLHELFIDAILGTGTSICVPLSVHGLRIFTIFQSQRRR